MLPLEERIQELERDECEMGMWNCSGIGHPDNQALFQRICEAIKNSTKCTGQSWNACTLVHPTHIVPLTEALVSARQMRRLDLTVNCLYSAGISHLCRGLMQHPDGNHLTHMNLSSTSVDYDGVVVLAEMMAMSSSQLQDLRLDVNRIGDDAVYVLGSVGVKGARHLQALGLGHAEMGERGCEGLGIGLAHCPTLTHLDITGNPMNDAGFAHIFQGLKTVHEGHTSSTPSDGPSFGLQELVLNHTSISTHSLALLGELVTFAPLTSLSLEYCFELPLDTGESFWQGLSQNTTLRVLHLDNTPLGAQGGQHLAGVLAVHPALLRVHMWTCAVGDVGVAAMTNALCRNPVLVGLDLFDNNITDTGVQAIVDMLPHHPFLTRINLKANHITDIGARALAQGMAGNGSLRLLFLDDNPAVTEAGIKAFVPLFESETSACMSLHSYLRVGSYLMRDNEDYQRLGTYVQDRGELHDALIDEYYGIKDLATIQSLVQQVTTASPPTTHLDGDLPRFAIPNTSTLLTQHSWSRQQVVHLLTSVIRVQYSLWLASPYRQILQEEDPRTFAKTPEHVQALQDCVRALCRYADTVRSQGLACVVDSVFGNPHWQQRNGFLAAQVNR